MNFLTIAGHLGADPEVRFISSGKKVTTMRVATNTRRNGADDTIWWRVTIWGEQFDKMIAFFKKGSAIVVFGELQKPEIFHLKNEEENIFDRHNHLLHNLQLFTNFGHRDAQIFPDAVLGERAAGL